MPVTHKKLSNEQEKQLVEEYRQGATVQSLMEKYGYKSKKSITDKVKKHYPNEYKEIIQKARNNRKTYDYNFSIIRNEFDAYFIGLMLTDGYISRETDIGIDLIDEDCIAFLSKIIGKPYKTYYSDTVSYIKGREIKPNYPRHRIVFSNKELVKNLERFGITSNKTYTLQGPMLLPEEEQYIPYIIRGIIDGDGTVSSTSYGAPQFKIYSQSKDFLIWCSSTLTNKMYMKDIKIREEKDKNGFGYVETALQENILKLISLSYNKPFGMSRKYENLRKTFRDYNSDLLLSTENSEEDGIVQTTTSKTDGLGN